MDLLIIENVNKMLIKRNYTNIKPPEKICIKKKEYPDLHLFCENTKNQKVLVLFLYPNYANNNKKKKIIDFFFSVSSFPHYIIIQFFKKKIEIDSDKKIEFFNYKEFLTDVTEHELQPTFEKISDSETLKDIKTKIKNINKLPKMLLNDPISKFYDYEQGDIIKIDNKGILSLRLVI